MTWTDAAPGLHKRNLVGRGYDPVRKARGRSKQRRGKRDWDKDTPSRGVLQITPHCAAVDTSKKGPQRGLRANNRINRVDGITTRGLKEAHLRSCHEETT